METPTEGLGLLHMRGSGAERLIIFSGFIFSPTGIFRLYIEFRETHKSSFSFLDVYFGSLQGCCPEGEGVCIWEGSIETQQYGFIKNFDTINFWHTVYLIPKNTGNNFHKKMIQHKQFPV